MAKRLKAPEIIKLIKGFQCGTDKAVLAKKFKVSRATVNKWYARWDKGSALLTLDDQLEITDTYRVARIVGAIGF